MKQLWLVAIALVGSAASSEASDTKPPRKPEPSKPCSSWRGRVQGNDPDVAITATLCREQDGRVHGRIVWSGRSGRSVRDVEGSWSRQTLTLRDAKLAGTPSPGWRFCPIERYSLTQAGGRKLEGSYRSAECNDNAAISLERT